MIHFGLTYAGQFQKIMKLFFIEIFGFACKKSKFPRFFLLLGPKSFWLGLALYSLLRGFTLLFRLLLVLILV